ncbi:Mutator-like protein transposase [Cinnamomum micranthum f. kanehirae]|uniref:Mutator-like protein transposase n=1 Tax=Cinnamomum micranthum f. kanehirae TaxID=337451 RepID=A0A3S3P1M9_9MAGN|nr:Mutator-like protein transposase [Cinnamomum micranthum f. kanehirae]
MGEESTVPVLCSFGGEIVPKCGKFVYEGGTTRLMRVHRSINFLNLLCRVNEIFKSTAISTIKYRYPGLELDFPLVSVTTDEDVSGMMQEFSSPMATPIHLFAEPRHNLDNGTIQSTPSILQNSEITSSSHMVDAYRQDGDGTIFSHSHGQACHMQYSSRQDLDNVTLQATPSIFHEKNETNTSSPGMFDDILYESDLNPLIHLLKENTAMGGIETGVGSQPQVVDNSGDNTTSKIDFSLSEGQEFRNADAFDMALREHAIRSSFEYRPMRTDQGRIDKTCIKDRCPWYIHASKVPGGSSFRIKALESNHAHEIAKLTTHRQASQKWVANFVRGQVRKHLYSTPDDIVAAIDHVYGIEVNYYMSRRGKDLALKEVHIGTSLYDLAAYCDEIERTNPSSFVTLDFPSYALLGIFIAYHATRHGFEKACRPIISLYSRNIGGDYPHVWLYATGLDGGYNSFLVAYAVVESSNQETWSWFCRQLARILLDSPEITIITVKQEKSSEAVGSIFQKAHHRYCRKLLCEDFYRKFKDKDLLLNFRKAIDAESEAYFRLHMDEISRISPEAQKWIKEISPTPNFWAVSCFDGQQDCIDYHLSAEEFDIWRDDGNAMNSSVISMMRLFHTNMREIFLRNQVQESSDEDRQLTPYALGRLDNVETQLKLSFINAKHHCQRQFYTESIYDNDNGHIVDLTERTCTCRIWQLHKFPCCHAVAAIRVHESNVLDYCEHYTVANCREAYSEFIHPISNVHHMKDTPRTSGAKKRTYSKRNFTP